MNLTRLDVITAISVKICVPLHAYKKGDYFKIYLGKWQRLTCMAVILSLQKRNFQSLAPVVISLSN